MTSLFNNSDDENDNSPISSAPKTTLPPLVKTSFDEYDNNSLRKKCLTIDQALIKFMTKICYARGYSYASHKQLKSKTNSISSMNTSAFPNLSTSSINIKLSRTSYTTTSFNLPSFSIDTSTNLSLPLYTPTSSLTYHHLLEMHQLLPIYHHLLQIHQLLPNLPAYSTSIPTPSNLTSSSMNIPITSFNLTSSPFTSHLAREMQNVFEFRRGLNTSEFTNSNGTNNDER
nr:1465_t:CDS:2 [Entrophospora candida]